MVHDPVCMTQLEPEEILYTSEYRGQTYYFDSEDCKMEFDDDPAAFSGRLAQERYGDLPYEEPLDE